MNTIGRVTAIIIGVLLLCMLAFFALPLASRATSENTGRAAATASIEGPSVTLLENLASELSSAREYSLCVVKTVSGQEASYTMNYYCTVVGSNYAIQTEYNKQTLRQLYIDGVYSFIDDTDKIVYKDAHVLNFPDAHLFEALTGRPIATESEIINGYQVNCVEVYKDGIVYAFYFNELGDLVRFYYIYNTNSVTLDFCRIVIGRCPERISFVIPYKYTKSNVKPKNLY